MKKQIFGLKAVLVFLLLLGSAANGQTLSDALSEGESLALTVAVSGEVAEVLVAPGEQVKKGQLLVSLNVTGFQSALAAAKATLAYAKFKVQLVREDYERQQELYDEGSLSSVELQILELGVLHDEVALAHAQAAHVVALSNLAYARITAPVNGEVVALPVVGQRVSVAAGLPVLVKLHIK